MTRSPAGMNSDSAFRSVVLPEPVPPETTMGQRAATAERRKSDMAGVSAPARSRSPMPIRSSLNMRRLSAGPSGASGGTTNVARARPPGSMAHPMACASSQRMPACSAILSMILRTCPASSKAISGRYSNRPARSTYTMGGRNGSDGSDKSTPPPFTITSVMDPSSSSGWSGP